ncbi:unnamed protein product [Cylicocyclus nassatus]|uniref:Uncharacterized protein n=1 Tax=Cylicocyclus nassatus TaxID=53992 RepID=A0AA36GR08_CYLNA|nr:unnamed protein product [Cylicocyclus nassatus]
MIGRRILFVLLLFLVFVPMQASDDDGLVEVDLGHNDNDRTKIGGEGTETDGQAQGVEKESKSKKFSRQQDTILVVAIASAMLFV